LAERLIIGAQGKIRAPDPRLVYLAFLAPDIVERIVGGEQPIDRGVKRLLAMAPLPMDWVEQRRVLGFEH
jgi:site-specific DNA recombinase